MKSFLTAWLAEAPKILKRELSNELELCASAHLPQPETATTLALTLGDPYTGRFLVTTDRYALHTLLAGARVTDGSLDADRDRELWRGILQQIVAAAAQTHDAARAAQISVSAEDTHWTLGLPSAAYELRFGEIVMLVAFTDEIQTAETAPKTAPEPAPEAPSAPAHSTSAALPRIAPGGIDLLLDVELEASLRFGSREMPLSEVLDLGAGDVVELDRHVSDPVDLLVGDKIVARGEVVLVNGSFGLRVLEVAEPRKCLESIRCLF
ncbi:MAG: flagellar motor switch protein FliN [Silvibacterium sp.]